jgi:glycosyltransferase involved in cell wall biosynthesis
VAGRARVVIANSALTARHAVELLGADPARVHVVYYGADESRFRPPTAGERAAARARFGLGEGDAALAFVGALGDRRKGFDTLFDAFVRLARGAPWNATLLVAGAGGELEAWRRRAREAGVHERIRFLGFQADVVPLLHASDAMVAPTRYEAYGLAVQEAMCTGLPALVSRAAGVAERIPPPLAGLLPGDPDDADELARCLRAWRRGWTGTARTRWSSPPPCAHGRGNHMAARVVDIVERAG